MDLKNLPPPPPVQVAGSLVVVLAMEARDPVARARAQALLAAYGPNFRHAFATAHVLAAGEVRAWGGVRVERCACACVSGGGGGVTAVAG